MPSPVERPSPVEGSSQTSVAARQSRHQRGVCDPCVFFTTSLGCVRGKECRYCHLPHPGSDTKTENRPRKEIREKYKAAIQGLLQRNAGRLHEIHIHDDLQWKARQNTYIRKVLQGYLDSGLGVDGVPLPPPRPFATPDVGNFESPKLLATSPPIALGVGIGVGSGYARTAQAHFCHEAARDEPSESEESQTNFTETQNENESWNVTHPTESSSSALGSLIAIAKSKALTAPSESVYLLRTADLQ